MRQLDARHQSPIITAVTTAVPTDENQQKMIIIADMYEQWQQLVADDEKKCDDAATQRVPLIVTSQMEYTKSYAEWNDQRAALLQRWLAAEEKRKKAEMTVTTMNTTSSSSSVDLAEEKDDGKNETIDVSSLNWKAGSNDIQGPLHEYSPKWLLPPLLLLQSVSLSSSSSPSSTIATSTSTTGDDNADENKTVIGAGDIRAYTLLSTSSSGIAVPLSSILLIPMTTALHRASIIHYMGSNDDNSKSHGSRSVSASPFAQLPTDIGAIIADYVMILTWESAYDQYKEFARW